MDNSKHTGFSTSFCINYYQFLDQDGELIDQNILDKKLDILNNTDKLINYYKLMVLTRAFDNKAVALQRTGKMGTYPAILGQEAIGATMTEYLEPNDVFVPYYRDVSAMLNRGIKMEEILLYWGGDERGSDYSIKNKDFPICVPIATQYLHAAGVAAALKYKKQKNISIVTIGEGGTSKGDFYEALNVAGTWKLPIVFVVNNNQWAISVPRKKQSGSKTIAQKGIAADLDCVQVDGNDIIALDYVMKNAVNNARENHKPTLVEAISYRMGDHTTADDASRYRSNAELEVAQKKDPIKRMYNYLLKNNLWDTNKEQELLEHCTKQVDDAVTNYLNTPKQNPESMFDYLYHELPEQYLDQRDMAVSYYKK